MAVQPVEKIAVNVYSEKDLITAIKGTRPTEARLHVVNIKTFLMLLNYHDFPKVTKRG